MIFSNDEVLGLLTFGAIKLVGYYYVARRVARAYPPKVPMPLIVALARVALGALIAFLIASTFDVKSDLPWYLLLVALRAIEWGVVFILCYERTLVAIDWSRLRKASAFATLVSCLLDLPAVFGAFVVPALAYGIC